MAAYFIFSLISIHGRTVVNYYEVEEGSLVKEHNYTGLIIRREETVQSEAGGYIYYYVADGRKAASGSPVYLIDAGGDLSHYLSNNADKLNNINSSKLREIRNEVLSTSRSFSNGSFHDIYDIHDSILAKAMEYSSLSIFNSISDELEAKGVSFQKFLSPKNGTVCCYTDGYEDIDENNLTAELFDQTKYEKNTIKAGDLIEAGMPAYKLITDENWYIAFMLSDENLEELKDSSTLKIAFTDKGFDAKVSFKIVYGGDGNKYGLISMNSYLVQFTSNRFISFEIVTNDVSGLKIPDKAITTKDFYVIPTNYLAEDASGNVGFNKAIVADSGTSYEFVTTDIYSKDDDYCYIECDEGSALKAGDFVMLPAGSALPSDENPKESSLYQITAKMPLKGVYNVNKGYTIFRKVEILESSNGYSIIQKNTNYGLQTYDHIVLDASSVKDGEILYR